MEDRTIGINLIVDGVSYPLTIPTSEEPYYRRAARLINDTLIPYKQTFSGEGAVRVMTMAAIDIAHRLVTQTDNVGSADTMRKISELSRLLDRTLESGE